MLRQSRAVHLTDQLSLGAGIRFYEQERTENSGGYGDSPNYMNGGRYGDDVDSDYQVDGLTGEYRPTDRYTDVTSAKESGSTPRFMMSYDFRTETDSGWCYDLGLKSYWRDRTLLVNLAAYQPDRSDYRAKIQFVKYNSNCTGGAVANIGEARIRGLELETFWNPTEHVSIDAAVTYMDGQFVDPPIGVGSSLPGVDLKAGDQLRSIPPWKVSIGAQYSLVLPDVFGTETSGYIRADWRYVDERMNNYGDEELLKADPIRSWYFMDECKLLDVRTGFDTEYWSDRFYVSNVLDEEVMYDSSRNLRQPAIRVGATNQPRTYGFNLTRRWRLTTVEAGRSSRKRAAEGVSVAPFPCLVQP